MKQCVIIGNGVVAAGCIEGIRSIDKDSKITVVSEENYPVYCCPLISYYLENKTDPECMSYRGADFYEKMGCDVFYGKKVIQINTEKRLFTKDGLLKGFILIGKTERAGIYTSLIRERTPLDTIDFDTMKKIATSIAFSPEKRRKKFGSVV